MVCEGRMDELGLSDDVWTQLQQLRDIVQRAANDRVDKMARATYQLEEITACLNGASIPPLPQVSAPRLICLRLGQQRADSSLLHRTCKMCAVFTRLCFFSLIVDAQLGLRSGPPTGTVHAPQLHGGERCH
jgi:hypothetical protein